MPRRKAPPTEQQFETAIMWLQSNDGLHGEAEACQAVAAWIERCRHHDMLARTARQAGVTIAQLRRHLAGKAATPPDEMEN